ncbi:MAG: hypothetical protein KGI38_12625 [Thaumarchaeota archaeon]|nr:hypothetical protein [Nitrososphaerota archaeon]
MEGTAELPLAPEAVLAIGIIRLDQLLTLKANLRFRLRVVSLAAIDDEAQAIMDELEGLRPSLRALFLTFAGGGTSPTRFFA